jgi:hypothetical protein
MAGTEMFYARSQEIQQPRGHALNYDDAHEEAIAGDIYRIGCNLRLIGAPARLTAQAMRASLLASAIVSTLRWSRFDACSIQGQGLWRRAGPCTVPLQHL